MQLGIACLKTMITQLRFNICKLEDSRLTNAEIKDLPSQVKGNISDALQYSCLHWSNHLRSPPENYDRRALVLGSLKTFFEGLYPLFWVEVLSIMEMVPIGAPSLRSLISWVKVSTSPPTASLYFKLIQIGCRLQIQRFLREFRIFVISSSLSTPLSLSALRTLIFQRDHSCPPSHLYQGSSAKTLLR